MFSDDGGRPALTRLPRKSPLNDHDHDAHLTRGIFLRTTAGLDEDSGICGWGICDEQIHRGATGRGAGWDGPGQTCTRQVSTA